MGTQSSEELKDQIVGPARYMNGVWPQKVSGNGEAVVQKRPIGASAYSYAVDGGR